MRRLPEQLLLASRQMLPMVLLLALVVVLSLFLFDAPDAIGTWLFRSVFTLFAVALIGYAVVQVVIGLRLEFSAGAVVYLALALLFGLTGLKIVSMDADGGWYLLIAGVSYPLLFAGLVYWQRRGAARRSVSSRQGTPREQDNDPGIRGSVSVFMTGSDSYRFVHRHPDPDTRASRFQQKLLRYIERKLNRQLVAFSGDGCDYWRVPSEISRIELMVIGNGFNTRSRLADGNPWILRVCETEPYRFTDWIARHFPDGCAMTRKMPDGRQRTQFAGRCIDDERAFFRQEIPPPDLDSLGSLGMTPSEAMRLLDILEAATDKRDDGKLPERLH